MPILHNNVDFPESTGIIKHNTTEMRFVKYNSNIIWQKGNEVTYIWNGNISKEYYAQGSNVLNPTTFVPEKNGRTFIGWSNSLSSTEVLETYIMGTNPITLYAVWTYKHADADLGYGTGWYETAYAPARHVAYFRWDGLRPVIKTGPMITYDGSIYEAIQFDAMVYVNAAEGPSTVENAYGGFTINNIEDQSPVQNTDYRKWLRRSNWDSSGTGTKDDSRYPCYGNKTVSITVPTSSSEEYLGTNTLYWIFICPRNGSIELFSPIHAIGRTVKEVG